MTSTHYLVFNNNEHFISKTELLWKINDFVFSDKIVILIFPAMKLEKYFWKEVA